MECGMPVSRPEKSASAITLAPARIKSCIRRLSIRMSRFFSTNYVFPNGAREELGI